MAKWPRAATASDVFSLFICFRGRLRMEDSGGVSGMAGHSSGTSSSSAGAASPWLVAAAPPPIVAGASPLVVTILTEVVSSPSINRYLMNDAGVDIAVGKVCTITRVRSKEGHLKCSDPLFRVCQRARPPSSVLGVLS